jgi:S-adenosylmethionine decarboxylase
MTPPIPVPAYDGRHLLADLHGCVGLDDIALIEDALRAAVAAAGATLLEIRLHSFGPGHGITGMALLAESHISIHSWPEHGYAALDFFLCGTRHDLDAALAAVTARLRPERIDQRVVARGYGAAPATG